MKKKFKTYSTTGLAAGNSFSREWTADGDYKIKRIYLLRQDGSAFTASTFYLAIAGEPMTHDSVPAAVLGRNRETTPELDLEFRNGQKLEFTLTNGEGASIDVFVVFEYEKI